MKFNIHVGRARLLLLFVGHQPLECVHVSDDTSRAWNPSLVLEPVKSVVLYHPWSLGHDHWIKFVSCVCALDLANGALFWPACVYLKTEFDKFEACQDLCLSTTWITSARVWYHIIRIRAAERAWHGGDWQPICNTETKRKAVSLGKWETSSLIIFMLWNLWRVKWYKYNHGLGNGVMETQDNFGIEEVHAWKMQR